MIAVVIDTNILLVANNKHDDVSRDCVSKCVESLLEIKRNAVVVIDDDWKIIREYQRKTSPNQPKGLGDAFLKWLLQNSGNTKRVQRVNLTETNQDVFAEFPGAELQERVDASDRKFIAVAHAHAQRPSVWQATDCKWIDWWPELRAAGVEVEFVCPQDACRFYSTKFPGKALPPLPGPK